MRCKWCDKELIITEQEQKLADALRKRGVGCVQQFCDGKKHIDITIIQAQIDIEVDGLDHFIDANQIDSDIRRGTWSSDGGFTTIHIANILIDRYLE
jgi:very-short-patch-repair endonuclease